MRCNFRSQIVTTLLLAPLMLAPLMLAPQAAQAQDAAPTAPPAIETLPQGAAPVPTQPDQTLPIPTLPGARLRMEVDARGDDLLGVVKSFLKGLDGQKLQQMLEPMTGTLVNGTSNTGNSNNGPRGGMTFARMLAGINLAEMLKDVDHIHFVMMETPPPRTSPARPAGGKPAPRPAAAPPQSSARFYEQAFRGEGGRRLAWADFDDVQMVTLGFQQPHGFATVLQAPGMVMVLRTDGYPNLEGVGPLMMMFFVGVSGPMRF